MADANRPTDERPPDEGSWEAAWLRQVRRGLRMTFEERLEWLDEAVEGLRQIQGAASGEPPRES